MPHDQAPWPYESIKKSKTYELVAEQLRAQVSDQRLTPGDPIPTERELSALYGVSRSSVREGLRLLGSLGIIEQTSSGSFFVAAYTRPLNQSYDLLLSSDQVDIKEVFEMRRLLECETAALAAVRRTSDDIAMMDDALAASTLALKDDSASLFVDADLRFHLVVAEAAGNRLIYHTMYATRDLLRQVFIPMFRVAGTPQDSIKQHTAIRNAIQAADGAAAREAMYTHLHAVESAIAKSAVAVSSSKRS